MNYYERKREKTLKIVELIPLWFVFAILFSAGLHACGQAIDREQEQNLLSPSDRVEVVSRW